MSQSAQTKTDIESPLPAGPLTIPVFPLAGVLLLPRGNLPLNIFEPRYKAMVEDALKGDRLIGMIQPRSAQSAAPSLYKTGCIGRINTFSETEDRRYLITLAGLCRFDIAEELQPLSGYRRVVADYASYEDDLTPADGIDLDRTELKAMLSSYFSLKGLSCDWNAIDGAPDEKLITCLSMVCPFEAGEKQALLEASCGRERARRFMTMLKMAVHDHDGCCGNCH